jgi:lipopolysaccharide/colanic/teichoic acid biosynthesis glycosyltransferase
MSYLQKSMNNSELSIMNSSEDVFTTPQTYVGPPRWEDLPNERSRNNALLQNGCCDNRIAEVECVEATSSENVRDIRFRPWEEVEQPDLGLWLLHGSPDRHDQWERLRRVPVSDVTTRHYGLPYSSSILKRSCDVIGSMFFLVMLFPLFIVVAILIKLDSPGPIFFRHYRVGKDGSHFVLWKFRSMRTDVPVYEASPRSGVDDRLTRIGRIIRRLSVDEIPQLMNVIKGDMSLVGPRPEMPFIVARYHSVERERLISRPGITGLWQISPARAFPIHENLHYDLHYIRNQNFFLDCAIILRTITAVIHGIGAV